jgi:hypothetical protein
VGEGKATVRLAWVRVRRAEGYSLLHFSHSLDDPVRAFFLIYLNFKIPEV